MANPEPKRPPFGSAASDCRHEWELINRCIHCEGECLAAHDITKSPRTNIDTEGGFDLLDFLADPKHAGFAQMFSDLLKGFDAPSWRQRRMR